VCFDPTTLLMDIGSCRAICGLEGIPRLEAHLVVLKNPILALQKVIQRAEDVADNPARKGSSIAVRPDLGLSGALFTGTRAVLGGLFTTVPVLYFLLVAGDISLRRIVGFFADVQQQAASRRYLSADPGGHTGLSDDDHGHERGCGSHHRGRHVSLWTWRPVVVGRLSLPAQLHFNFGSAAWDRNISPRRNAEFR
jgi:hypothetical protein